MQDYLGHEVPSTRSTTPACRASVTGAVEVALVPSLVWWNFPMTLSGDFDGSLSGGEVKRLSELSAERAPAVDLP